MARPLRLTLLSERRGSLVLLVQAPLDPLPEQWEGFLDDTSEAMAENGGRCRVLVFTAGGKPNAALRSRSLERGWKESRDSPVAVVSDDRLVRGVITVFSWFGLAIRGVRPDRLDEAFTHLELTSEEQAWVLSEREKLEEQLGVVRSVRRTAQG
jgi:hypothetical protein